MIQSKSYAKINLGLEVLSKRTDGFHTISSVITKINLFDEISVEIANKNSISYYSDTIAENQRVSVEK